MTVNHARTVWVEQCRATMAIRQRFGVESAFDYLVAEKLMNFAEAAWERPEFARELPGFVAEVRRIFSVPELRKHLARMEREQKMEDAERAEAATLDEPDDDFADPPALVAARQERFGILKAMLLEVQLGTS